MECPPFRSKGVENRPFQVARLDSGAGSLRVLGSGPRCGLAIRGHLVLPRLQQPCAPVPSLGSVACPPRGSCPTALPGCLAPFQHVDSTLSLSTFLHLEKKINQKSSMNNITNRHLSGIKSYEYFVIIASDLLRVFKSFNLFFIKAQLTFRSVFWRRVIPLMKSQAPNITLTLTSLPLPRPWPHAFR